MSKSIPYGRQSISNDDIDEVRDVLNSDFPRLSSNSKIMLQNTQCKITVATNSAISPLYSACVALGER